MNQIVVKQMSLPAPIKILIAEDHQLLRMGLMLLLSRAPGIDVIGEAADGEEAVNKILSLRPDVAIIDIGLPSMDGIEVTYQIKAALPHIRVIVLTSHAEGEHIFAALGASADAYCLKDIPVEQLGKAISVVMSGGTWLDPRIADRVIRMSRDTAGAQSNHTSYGNEKSFDLSESEKDLLVLVEQGLDNQEIASRLSIKTDEVSFLLRGIFERLFLGDRVKGDAKFLRRQVAAEMGDRAVLSADGKGAEEALTTLCLGTVFADNYLVEALIGRGGIGRVYKAKHRHMDRTVAIKILLPQFSKDPQIIKQFKQEAKTAGALNHPNIVTAHDFGITAQGQAFLVMDFFEGRPLSEILREQVYLSLDQFFKIFAQVCDALEVAHSKNIVHCDLKPSNIIISASSDEQQIVKLVDFGMAQILTEEISTDVQEDSSQRVGSPFYMSPEQCKGRPVDATTDIYALGCVMYQALTGEIAFNGTTAIECFRKHVHGAPISFAQAAPGKAYPEGLEAVVFKSLQPNSADRFQSADELKAALHYIQGRLNR